MQCAHFLIFRSELDSYRLVHRPHVKKDFYPGKWRQNKNLVYVGGSEYAATLAALSNMYKLFDEVQKTLPVVAQQI